MKPISLNLLPLRPGTLISLADMMELFAAGLVHNWHWLKAERARFGQKLLAVPSELPTAHEIHNLNALLKHHNAPIAINGKNESIRGWLYYCELLGMDKSKSVIEHFLMVLNVTNSTPNLSVVDSQLLAVENSLWYEMFERRFVFIPQYKVFFFDNKNLFGGDICEMFPTAELDMKDGGNCVAADLHNAAVFHFLRVAELGMRRLVIKLQATIFRDKQEIFQPDEMTCDELVRAVQNKIESEKKKPADQRLVKNHFKEYLDLAKQFDLLRNDRNDVAHIRKNYNSSEALDMFERVRHFMQKLAKQAPFE